MSDRLTNFLLVEDDDDHAVLIERTLDRERIKNSLFRVADGEAALQYLNAEPPYEERVRPDVVLLDINLPKLSGHEVLQAMKADNYLSQIPVVVLTSSDAEIDRTRAYQHNVNSYVVKPVDFTRFRQMVQDLSLYWGVWNVSPTRTTT